MTILKNITKIIQQGSTAITLHLHLDAGTNDGITSSILIVPSSY